MEQGRNQMPIEYILIRDINDSPKTRPISSGCQTPARQSQSHPGNTVEGFRGTPFEERCRTFRDAVHKARIPVTMRYEKGHDINAACGQLRLRKNRKRTMDAR
ncbi:MAG: hypothetical protein ACLSUW_04515 [Akkermansia sp.]